MAVISDDDDPASAHAERFAQALLGEAGISFGEEIRIDLDSLAQTTHRQCAALIHPADPPTWTATAADRLDRNADRVFARRETLTQTGATAIRVSALALALRATAAGITLLESRTSAPDLLECLILVRA